MTIDEKLRHFYDVTVDDARAKADAQLSEHRKKLDEMFEAHKALSTQNADALIKAETDGARREINKALSAEQLTIRRERMKKQNDLKEKLFGEVSALLKEFQASPEYEDYLLGKINEAVKFAEGDDLTVSLSPEDAGCLESLSRKAGIPLSLAEESFMGGIKAVIPAKNILIDNSFLGNYNTLFRQFKFDGGYTHE